MLLANSTKSPFSSLTCSLTALPADVAVVPSAFTLISCNSASPVVEPSGSEVIVSILDFNVSSVSFALLISLVKLLFMLTISSLTSVSSYTVSVNTAFSGTSDLTV